MRLWNMQPCSRIFFINNQHQPRVHWDVKRFGRFPCHEGPCHRACRSFWTIIGYNVILTFLPLFIIVTHHERWTNIFQDLRSSALPIKTLKWGILVSLCMEGLGGVNFDTIAVDWKDMAHLRIVEGKEYFVTISLVGQLCAQPLLAMWSLWSYSDQITLISDLSWTKNMIYCGHRKAIDIVKRGRTIH